MENISPSLLEELQICTRKLTIYKDPETLELWLYDNETEGFTTCNYAVSVAKLLQRVVKCTERPRGYVLPPHIPLQNGKHSLCDAFGAPWETDHEIGCVIHCDNQIYFDDIGGGQSQSILDRLYYRYGDVPPTNLCHALVLSQRVHGATWYTMKAHKSKRQGLLSRCNCCKPPRVLRISWEYTSSPEQRRYCQQELQAWIGLSYDTLPPDLLYPSRLPSV